MLGAIAEATERIELRTGVTCPTTRVHPAIVAQAAATAATLLPGRFSLGLGSGEKLNEHILGDRWPPDVEPDASRGRRHDSRAVAGQFERRGAYYTVENARIYSLPQEPVPILVAVAGSSRRTWPRSSATADRHRAGGGDWSASREAGGDKPPYGQLPVCWAASEEEGGPRRIEVAERGGPRRVPDRSCRTRPTSSSWRRSSART